MSLSKKTENPSLSLDALLKAPPGSPRVEHL